jgi:hypothetical protein
LEVGLDDETYVSAATGKVRLLGMPGVVTEAGLLAAEWLPARSNASMV